MGTRRATTDPALTRQLKAAKGSQRSVEAVLTLRQSTPVNDSAAASVAQATADDVLGRVEREVGLRATHTNVLGNLGVVVVAAPEPFLQSLLRQPEIESAAANDPG
jgi:hypothetical protein